MIEDVSLNRLVSLRCREQARDLDVLGNEALCLLFYPLQNALLLFFTLHGRSQAASLFLPPVLNNLRDVVFSPSRSRDLTLSVAHRG